MLRLGHISFFGLAFLNLAFSGTVFCLQLKQDDLFWSSRLLIIGLASMPVVCYLSAIEERYRHLFFIPVGSLVSGVGLFVFHLLFSK